MCRYDLILNCVLIELRIYMSRVPPPQPHRSYGKREEGGLKCTRARARVCMCVWLSCVHVKSYDTLCTHICSTLSAMQKRDLKRLVQSSQAVVEARDKARGEFGQLVARSLQTTSHFDEQFKHLGSEIEQDKLINKLQIVQHMEKQTRTTRKDGRGNYAELGMVARSGFEEQLKKRIALGTWGREGADQGTQKDMLSEDKVEAYETAFAKIQAASGIKDIDELIDQFIEAEDKVQRDEREEERTGERE